MLKIIGHTVAKNTLYSTKNNSVRRNIANSRSAVSLDLTLNQQKWEILLEDESFANVLAKVLPCAIRVKIYDAFLLGAPLSK